MKKSILKNLIALTALAVMACFTGKTQATPPNNWTNVGASPGGGYIIVGNSTMNLGPLSQGSIPVYLSANGYNIITLDKGSTASSSSYTIELEEPGDTLNNYGSLIGTTDEALYVTSNGNTMNNWGAITSPYYTVDIEGNNNVFNNWGTVSATGASGYYAVYLGGANNTFNNWGLLSTPTSTTYYTIYVPGTNNTFNNWGTVYSGYYAPVYIAGSNNITNNWGTIYCAEYYSLFMYGTGNITNNWGTISAPYDPVYEDGTRNILNNWGKIIATAGADYGVYSEGAYFTLNNWGTISASIDETVYSSGGNFLLNNWGTVTSASAYAVYVDASNNTVNNWGKIAAYGSDPAIYISGNANTLNLWGHSSVTGKISVAGTGNVVNLNLSGVPATMLPGLNASLAAQGVNSGVPTVVTFTLRGDTINIDPAIVDGHLTSYQLQARTPNEAAIGADLDSLTFNPAPGTPLFNLLDAIDQSGNVPMALNQLSPEKFEIFSDIALSGANFNSLQIDERLNNLRDGSENIDTTGIGGDTTTAGFDKDAKDNKGVIQTNPPEKRWGFFASGDVTHANIDAQQGLQSAKFTTAGLVLGLDGKVNDHWVVGTLFSYQHTSADLDAQGSQANIDSLGGGLYAGYHNGGWYGNGLATYTRNDYDTTRVVLFPGFNGAAIGSTSSDQFAVNIDGGYDFNLNQSWTAGPILGLQYVHLGVDGFTETGATATNLAVGSQDVDSLRSRLGFRIAYHKQIGKEVSFAAEARAEWQHEFLDDSRGISASFAGSGLAPFSVQTANPERDAALVGIGLNVTVRNRMTIFADYDVQAGQQSYFEQTVRGGLKFAW